MKASTILATITLGAAFALPAAAQEILLIQQ